LYRRPGGGVKKSSKRLRRGALGEKSDYGVSEERRLEGLEVPQKQPKRGRLWLNDGSCIRLQPMKKDPEALGKMALLNLILGSFGMSFSMGRS
jgi:hypothetical protein